MPDTPWVNVPNNRRGRQHVGAGCQDRRPIQDKALASCTGHRPGYGGGPHTEGHDGG